MKFISQNTRPTEQSPPTYKLSNPQTSCLTTALSYSYPYLNTEVQNTKFFSRITYVMNDMTDEIILWPIKNRKKPPISGSNRDSSKRNVPSSPNPKLASANMVPQPFSRSSNEKAPTNTTPTELGSDTTSRRGVGTSRKPDQERNNVGLFGGKSSITWYSTPHNNQRVSSLLAWIEIMGDRLGEFGVSFNGRNTWKK